MNYFLFIGVLMFASRTKIAAGVNATSATTVVPTAGTAAPGSSDMAAFTMLAEMFRALKAKDEALIAKDEALAEKDEALTEENKALSAEFAALKAKVGALRKGCMTGSFRENPPAGISWSYDSTWKKDHTVNFGQSYFQNIPKVTASISSFRRHQQGSAGDDTTWGIDLSVLSPRTNSASIHVNAYSTYVEYVVVSWVACAA